MSKSVNVDFVTRQIEVDTDGKEYYVSAAVAAKDAEQSMLNAQNAADRAEFLVNGNFPYVTPEMFGAVGDGEAHIVEGVDLEAKAIQDAIDSGSMVILNKRYYITTSIQFRRFTKIKGVGYAEILYAGNSIDNTDVCIKMCSADEFNVYPELIGVEIRNINEKAGGIGIYINNSQQGGLIENCRIYNFNIGIKHSDENNQRSWLNNIVGGRISNCNIAIEFNSNSNGCSVERCKINNNVDGVVIKRSSCVNITNCEFENNNSNDYVVKCISCSAVNIQSCYFENNSDGSVNSNIIKTEGNTTNLNIIGNYFNVTSVVSAIVIGSGTDVPNVNILSNHFFGSGTLNRYCIDVSAISGARSTIIGNTVETSKINISLYWQGVFVDGKGIKTDTVKIYKGTLPTLEFHDNNNTTFSLAMVNNKLRFVNNTGKTFITANGDTQKLEFALPGGTTSNRPSAPLNGQMFVDYTLNKVIWARDNVWRDMMGNQV